MVRIALCGYGRMGRHIEQTLLERGIKPAVIIDKFAEEAQYKELDADALRGIDVVIDFSSPDTVMDNIRKYVELSVNVVMGTTGWYERIDEVRQLVGDKIGFMWSGNYSLGVQLYMKIVAYASQLVGKYGVYDPMVHEFHHKEKKDSPSGTALMIADLVKSGFPDKSKLVSARQDQRRGDDEIHVSSTRGGYIPGTHMVMFDSPVDTIELKHTARTREGFAGGAVNAALWLAGKKGFFRFEEMFAGE